jgi:hypothetical protein
LKNAIAVKGVGSNLPVGGLNLLIQGLNLLSNYRDSSGDSKIIHLLLGQKLYNVCVGVGFERFGKQKN